MCAGVCSVLWQGHTPREAGNPEPAASQNPATSVRAGPGFKRPQKQLCAARAVWNLSKPSFHLADSVVQSLSLSLYKCLYPD